MTFTPNWKMAGGGVGVAGRPLNTNDATPQMLTGQTFEAQEPYLGHGVVEYVLAAGAVAVGQVVEFVSELDPGGSGTVVSAVQPWAGTANSARPLGVAICAIAAGQYGFVQVEGCAAVNVSGAIAAGNGGSWQAAGTLQAAAVAGKQVQGVVAATANGANLGTGSSLVALAASQAVYDINYPAAQGAIT